MMRLNTAMKSPYVKNAPALEEKNAILKSHSFTPKNVPAPSTSRKSPISVSEQVKPIPMNSPSSAESSTGFLLAKDSARAKMMQLTTMSGR